MIYFRLFTELNPRVKLRLCLESEFLKNQYNVNMYLKKIDQDRIDKALNAILIQTNKSYPEDSLIDIVKGLGIEVFLYDFGKFSDEVSGAVDARDEKSPKIYLNIKHSPERRTFTLAHELGHYLLHKHDNMKLRLDKYNYRVDTPEAKEETEANYFAASLLMPKDKFLSLLKESDSFEAIAKYFGVSESAARNRWRWLKVN